MENNEIITYLDQLTEGQKKILKASNDKTEQLAGMMALYIKKLELLEEFEVSGEKVETFEKLKLVLLESVTEMVEKL